MYLINPQWQGEARNATYHGAQEIKALYLADQALAEVPLEPVSSLERHHGIIGYQDILAIMQYTQDLLTAHQPERLITIGGSCSADVASAAYMNERYQSDLAMVYIDAHGDMNSPETSASGLFYGMPMRVLLGDHAGLFSDIIRLPYQPKQLLHLGVRGWDHAEWDYIQTHQTQHIPFDQLNADPALVVERLNQMGYQRVYIHLDIDVIDAQDFQHMTLPGSPGLRAHALIEILEHLIQQFDVVGLGLYQYAPAGAKHPVLSQIMQLIDQI